MKEVFLSPMSELATFYFWQVSQKATGISARRKFQAQFWCVRQFERECAKSRRACHSVLQVSRRVRQSFSVRAPNSFARYCQEARNFCAPRQKPQTKKL